MQTITQKYAIVYFLNQNVAELNKFRQKYDPQWEMISLHITIVYPLSDISEEQLIEHIESVIKNRKPFPIHLNGLIKSFDHCLFLLVKEGKEEITKLHEQLYSGILQPYLKNDIPFTPHVTIGYFGDENDELKKELYETALSEAAGMKINISLDFDSIALIKGDGINLAKVIRTFLLK